MKTPPYLAAWFRSLLTKHDRIAIVGAPRCGKTTLAKEVRVDDRPVLTSDDYQNLKWEEVPGKIIADANTSGPKWTAEGVMLARALRKGLGADAVVYLTKPRVEQLRGQQVMGKGIATVFNEWRRMDGGKTPVYRPPETSEHDDAEDSDEADA